MVSNVKTCHFLELLAFWYGNIISQHTVVIEFTAAQGLIPNHRHMIPFLSLNSRSGRVTD